MDRKLRKRLADAHKKSGPVVRTFIETYFKQAGALARAKGAIEKLWKTNSISKHDATLNVALGYWEARGAEFAEQYVAEAERRADEKVTELVIREEAKKEEAKRAKDEEDAQKWREERERLAREAQANPAPPPVESGEGTAEVETTEEDDTPAGPVLDVLPDVRSHMAWVYEHLGKSPKKKDCPSHGAWVMYQEAKKDPAKFIEKFVSLYGKPKDDDAGAALAEDDGRKQIAILGRIQEARKNAIEVANHLATREAEEVDLEIDSPEREGY